MVPIQELGSVRGRSGRRSGPPGSRLPEVAHSSSGPGEPRPADPARPRPRDSPAEASCPIQPYVMTPTPRQNSHRYPVLELYRFDILRGRHAAAPGPLNAIVPCPPSIDPTPGWLTSTPGDRVTTLWHNLGTIGDDCRGIREVGSPGRTRQSASGRRGGRDRRSPRVGVAESRPLKPWRRPASWGATRGALLRHRRPRGSRFDQPPLETEK